MIVHVVSRFPPPVILNRTRPFSHLSFGLVQSVTAKRSQPSRNSNTSSYILCSYPLRKRIPETSVTHHVALVHWDYSRRVTSTVWNWYNPTSSSFMVSMFHAGASLPRDYLAIASYDSRIHLEFTSGGGYL